MYRRDPFGRPYLGGPHHHPMMGGGDPFFGVGHHPGGIGPYRSHHTGHVPASHIYDLHRMELEAALQRGREQGVGSSHEEEPSGVPPAKPYIIEELPLVSLEPIDFAESSNRSCSICLEPFKIGDTVKRMPCAHFYCEDCIADWLLKHCTCPTCRYELPTDSDIYEKERIKRMRTRNPRFRHHELDRLSILQLKLLLHRLDSYQPVDRHDLIEHLIQSKSIDLIAEPKDNVICPQKRRIHRRELDELSISKLKKMMLPGDTYRPIEKTDLIDHLIRSESIELIGFESVTDSKPQFLRQELDALSISQLKKMMNHLDTYRPVDKTDLIERLIQSNAVVLIPEGHKEVSEGKNCKEESGRSKQSSNMVVVETVYDSDEGSFSAVDENAIEMFPQAALRRSDPVDKAATKSASVPTQPRVLTGQGPASFEDDPITPILSKSDERETKKESPKHELLPDSVATPDAIDDIWNPSTLLLNEFMQGGTSGLVLNIDSKPRFQGLLDGSKATKSGAILLITDKSKPSLAFDCLAHKYRDLPLKFGQSHGANSEVANVLFQGGLGNRTYPFLVAFTPTPQGFDAHWFREPIRDEGPIGEWIETIHMAVLCDLQDRQATMRMPREGLAPVASVNTEIQFDSLLQTSDAKDGVILLLTDPRLDHTVTVQDPSFRLPSTLANKYGHRFEFGHSERIESSLANVLFQGGRMFDKRFPMLVAFRKNPNGFNAQWYRGAAVDARSVSDWLESIP